MINSIKNRRSIRNYNNNKISQEKINILLEAATWAPSNGNSQPWEFIVTEGEYLKKISNIFYNWAKDYIPYAPYIAENKKLKMLEYAKNFGGAQTLIVVTYEIFDDDIKSEESLMATCAAIQNICLVASSEGLGSVWIAGHILHFNETKNILDIPKNRKIAGIIPLGFTNEDPPSPPRIKPKVSWLK